MNWEHPFKWVFLILCIMFFALGIVSPTNYAKISRRAALHMDPSDGIRWAYQGRLP
jgi:hypothetical protein